MLAHGTKRGATATVAKGPRVHAPLRRQGPGNLSKATLWHSRSRTVPPASAAGTLRGGQRGGDKGARTPPCRVDRRGPRAWPPTLGRPDLQMRRKGPPVGSEHCKQVRTIPVHTRVNAGRRESFSSSSVWDPTWPPRTPGAQRCPAHCCCCGRGATNASHLYIHAHLHVGMLLPAHTHTSGANLDGRWPSCQEGVGCRSLAHVGSSDLPGPDPHTQATCSSDQLISPIPRLQPA